MTELVNRIASRLAGVAERSSMLILIETPKTGRHRNIMVLYFILDSIAR
jgi:hypothetical protein